MSTPKSHLTRRAFARASLLRAGVLALAMFVPAHIFAADAPGKKNNLPKSDRNAAGAGPMKISIGWATEDITPPKPIELAGQYYQRISQGVRDPLSVTALAIEQTANGRTEQAVMVSMDSVNIAADYLAAVREAVKTEVPDLDPKMILLNATHIHSGPTAQSLLQWWKPAAGAMSPDEVRSFQLTRVVRAVVKAWRGRRPGRVNSASAYAPVGFCRRLIYADGTAMMYGDPSRSDCLGVEAGNDPEVRILFAWDEQDRLTGMIVNVACPAQVMESQYKVSADYFGELRKRLRATYGEATHVLAQVSAAGDQSPRSLPVQAKDPVNYWNETGVVAIAARLEKAVAEAYASARQNIARATVFRHTVADLALPVRRASADEYRVAAEEVKRLTSGFPDPTTASRELFARFVADTHAGEKRQPHGPFDNKELDFVLLENAKAVVQRAATQDRLSTFPMELHAIRLGDCAFVTNPFELYIDYGQMIQARSPAARTFVVQLACGPGRYLPTERAVRAGGYSALIINGMVGPEGGRMLVEASVRAIGQLWIE